MTPAAKRILDGLNQALSISCGEADSSTYCIHTFGRDAQTPMIDRRDGGEG